MRISLEIIILNNYIATSNFHLADIASNKLKGIGVNYKSSSFQFEMALL